MEYDVQVTRTSFAARTIKVSAGSPEEAEVKALDSAGDFEFSEHDAEYAVETVSPSP